MPSTRSVTTQFVHRESFIKGPDHTVRVRGFSSLSLVARSVAAIPFTSPEASVSASAICLRTRRSTTFEWIQSGAEF
ncbi:hypothetical protein HZS61_001005 [Fusarium oxysporum f. sp. conglutinans]|uniref:Uncharacterized protein n=1 Tax=Fusarium oxysporum f. sp. conglutinans TaxID=100902 RepID=A0A8H6H3Q7_FUSOX|nr:hypothetical protein HZS61_001005 [Fusarium oxysporum f. sp. conglutinans]